MTAGPDGAPAPGGVRLRGALARLALDAGRTVSKDVLVDALWGAEPSDAVTNALQALVARLRRALGADVVETVPGGYRLVVALARCLHAGGRQVEALAVLDRTRERLADELGVDPGPALDAARLDRWTIVDMKNDWKRVFAFQ